MTEPRRRMPRKRLARAGAAAGVLAVVLGAALAGHAWMLHTGLQQMREAGRQHLTLAQTELEADLARLAYLPRLLEQTPAVLELLDTPEGPSARDAVNRYLQGVAAVSGASSLFVLNRSGIGVAASNWNEPGSPIGVDLSFRPYMQETLAHGRGSFYGMGYTSKRIGYYQAYALRERGSLRGVAAVKVDLEKIEQAWRKLSGVVLLVDERGVAILASRSAWKLRPLAPLAAEALIAVAASRPYGAASLAPLGWRTERELGPDATLATVAGRGYLATAGSLEQPGWRLIVLDDLAPARARARSAAAMAALGAAVLLLLATVFAQRQRGLRQRLAGQVALQKAYASLELKVAERTAELRGSVARLAEEVEVRKAAEAELRQAQDELVHAGKMVAMGQISAGLVHELNQPLAAMRTLSDNAGVFLEQGRPERVRENLGRIAQIVDRLGRLIYQLKVFARKDRPEPAPVPLRRLVAQAQLLLAGRLREGEVTLETRIEPEDLAVWGEETRLEQVLVNLLGNAVDAMAASPSRRLTIEAGDGGGGTCLIRISDSGPGIRADLLPRLFEPFVTSKPAGAGLGLGLMISRHIVRELGGSLGAGNLAGGGACFTIELPLAAAAEHRSA